MNINNPQYSKNSNDPSKNPSEDHPSEIASQKNIPEEPVNAPRSSEDKVKSSEAYTQKEMENQKAQRERLKDKSRDYRETKKIDELYSYATSNKEQTIAYILLALGLILLLIFNSLFGGLLIGMVAGYYFAPEIIHYIRNFGQIMGGEDHLRYVILTALLIGFFITSPGIFIGAIIVAIFKQVIQGPRNTSNEDIEHK